MNRYHKTAIVSLLLIMMSLSVAICLHIPASIDLGIISNLYVVEYSFTLTNDVKPTLQST